MKNLVTGATGLVGTELVRALGEADCVILSRDPERGRRAFPASRVVTWDGESAIDASAFEGVSRVFHLAGEPVAKGRLSGAHKQRVLDSRTKGTRALVESMGRAAVRPLVMVAASGIGFYGSRGSEVLTEDSTRGSDFLADVCLHWENASREAESLGVRVACVRLGMVLSLGGGALAKMLPAFRMGVAGELGDGQQWVSYLHLRDAVRLFRFLADTPAATGAFNGSTPNPITNAEFTKALGRHLGRPTFFRAPKALLRLGFGELADVVLASQRAMPSRATALGFAFTYPTIDAVFADLFGGSRDVAPSANA
jgi:uncharacterized protein (TIGR01777 family)